MPDNTERVVFTNEVGFKFFDFGIKNDTFKVNYILPSMNKKLLINILRDDLKMIAAERHFDAMQIVKMKGDRETAYRAEVGKNNYWYFFTDSTCKQLNRIELGSKSKTKVSTTYSGENYIVPDSISIAHKHIRLKLTLKLLKP